MSETINNSLGFAEEHRNQNLATLIEYVRIPSISTDPERASEMQVAAEWTARLLRDIDIENVQVLPTSQHPVVYGDHLHAGKDAPTVLIYGHYDVQPAEPLELWDSPPFEPTIRGDNLYGRGASDMKGQVVISIKAIEALLKTGNLNINVKFLIEGEEEIGSPSLDEFLTNHKDLLVCDFALNPDTGILGKDTPSITYGLRGLAYFELNVYGPDTDLHSGIFGGAVHNPAQILCELIAGMHDEAGRITLPGFYDSVRSLSEEERAEFARLPNNDAHYIKTTGAPALFGEKGYRANERVGARPTLEVNGLLSGYTGDGSKTVLPSQAMAKISTRLVPDQDPDQVHQQLLQYLEMNAPDTVRWKLSTFAGAPASVADTSLPAVQSLRQAMEETWGVRPLFKREGGSVPVVAQMETILNTDSILTGFGLPDDNLHAPNEKIHLPTFYRGIETFIRYFSILGNP
jgi:acetylornithine deacetylase/succinyl-diaminopimelate desuccinylase-like protein